MVRWRDTDFPIRRTLGLTVLLAAAVVVARLDAGTVAAVQPAFFSAVATILPVLFLAMFVEHGAVGLPFAEEARQFKRVQAQRERAYEADMEEHERSRLLISPEQEGEELRAAREDVERAHATVRRGLDEAASIQEEQTTNIQNMARALQHRFLRIAVAVAVGEIAVLYALGSGDHDIWFAAFAVGSVGVVTFEVVSAFLLRLRQGLRIASGQPPD